MSEGPSPADFNLGCATVHDAFVLLPSGGVMDEIDLKRVRALLSRAEILLARKATAEERSWVRAAVHQSTKSNHLG